MQPLMKRYKKLSQNQVEEGHCDIVLEKEIIILSEQQNTKLPSLYDAFIERDFKFRNVTRIQLALNRPVTSK